MFAPVLLLAAVLLLAYANGANDNFKGVATLYGTGTADYTHALTWATLTTFAGSAAALLLSDRLVKTFTGAGLVPAEMVGSGEFVAAVALGAGATVLLATLLSFPISTTHALTGALVGAGAVLASGDIRLSVLGSKFILPLLLSPLLALSITAMLYPALRRFRGRLGVTVEQRWTGSGEVAVAVSGVSAQGALTIAHFASAGAVSFARGLNDTPKIVALLVAAQAIGVKHGLAVVGLGMAAGGILSARRVAETMSTKITGMNHGQGFTANLVTAGLVIAASPLGMPVSTTHVCCGSLFGLGAVTGQAKFATIGTILASWIITLPAAVVFAGASAFLFSGGG